MLSLTQLDHKLSDGRGLLTHSRMQCAKECLRKHWLRYELGLRLINQDKRALRIGHAAHLGVERWEKGDDQDIAVGIATASYDVSPDWVCDDETFYDWLIERAIVEALLHGYFWRWHDDPIETVAAEETFCLSITNPKTGAKTPTFDQAGKIDGIVRLPDGRLAVRELKTCGHDIDDASDYWRRLILDSQISMYMLAAQQSGHDIETSLYDVIRKPTIKPRAIPVRDENGDKVVRDAQGDRVMNERTGKPRQSADKAKGYVLETRPETPDEYRDRILEDMGERPDFYFRRREIPRLESELEEFRDELWDQQLQLRHCQKHDRWYRNTASCVTVYGRCEYLDICTGSLDPSVDVPAGFERVSYVHPELVEGVDDAD